MKSSLNYVDGINDKRITLFVNDKCLRKKIKSIGGNSFFIIREAFEIKVKSEQHKIELLQKLIDMEIYFVGGDYGWPPAEIVNYYREKGLLSGKIKQICWLGPGRPILEDR